MGGLFPGDREVCSSQGESQTLSSLTCKRKSESESRSVVSDSLQPHGLVMSDSLQPHGLYSLWNSPGQNTNVGSRSLLQGIFPTQGLKPGLPHCRRILYPLSHKRSPRILEWIAYPFSRASSQPRNRTGISCRWIFLIAQLVKNPPAKGGDSNTCFHQLLRVSKCGCRWMQPASNSLLPLNWQGLARALCLHSPGGWAGANHGRSREAMLHSVRKAILRRKE